MPLITRSEPKANGPRTIPATSSPSTEGIFRQEKISPNTLAEKTRIHMVKVACITVSSSAILYFSSGLVFLGWFMPLFAWHFGYKYYHSAIQLL